MSIILVIEDDEQTASLLQSILDASGYEVIVARSADAGLELIPQLFPDLIMMDMRLPGLKGWDAARMIKSDPNYAHIPIFAVTVEISPEDRDAAFQAGCDEFIPKPFDIRELRAIIAQYV